MTRKVALNDLSMSFASTMKTSSRICIFVLALLVLNGAAEAKQRVCVIGAGMAGLAAIKLLSDHPHDFELIAFDKHSDVGGMWIYTNSTDVDEHGLPVHSSLYRNMRVNLPKQIMTYPDYQHFTGREDRSYVSHGLVLEYMRNYTDHYNLRHFVKFNTLVEKVTPINGNGDWRTSTWNVQTRNLNTNEKESTICNAVTICNGHFFQPNIPKIPGIENFPGRVFHSHVYRHPEEFIGKTVVLLGASTSGTDIGIELSKYAKTVYLSHRHDKLTKKFPENLIQVRGVVAANDKSELILQDGSKITADAFIYCTGYHYAFPFLDKSSGIFMQTKKHVRPLYKYLVNVEHPSMALIGLPNIYVKGTLFYSQVKYFINLLLNKIQLPSYEKMMEDSKLPPPDMSIQNTFGLYETEWDYNSALCKEGGFEPMPSFYEKIMQLYLPLNAKHVDFKDYDLKFLNNGDPIFVHRNDSMYH